MRDRRAGIVIAGLLLLFVAHAAWGGTPMEQLRGSIEKVLKTVDGPALKGNGKVKERRMAVRTVANNIFDFTETAKRALGPHWQGRTEEEREEFVNLFADLLEHSYIAKIERYEGENIQYAGEQLDGDYATVQTKFLTKQGQAVQIDYQMFRRGDRWLVYDVVIEGVSLISNYRDQFNKIIQTSSYEELVKKLKAKQKEFLEEDAKG